MKLSPEESCFLEKLKKVRPDLIRELKKEHLIEWKTKNRAKALAGVELTLKRHRTESEKTEIEKAVAKKTKAMACIKARRTF